MRRILLRAGMSPLVNHNPTRVVMRNMIGNNIGNMLFQSSVSRTLLCEDTTIDTVNTVRKYSNEHIILLIYTYYLKNFLSIGDIQKLLNPMIESYFDASGTDTVNLTSIYNTVVELARDQYQLDKQGIFASYEIVYKKLTEQHPDTSMEEKSYLQDFTFVALLSYDIYLKTQLVEKIIDQLTPVKPDNPEQAGSSGKEARDGREPKKK